MNKVTAAALVTLAACAPYALAQDGWFPVAETKDGMDTYSIKFGSGDRSTNKAGETVTVVVGKHADKKAGSIALLKWYVTDTDCDQEYGKLVILEIDGTYKFETAFAKGSNNVASGIAEALCTIGAKAAEEAASKGI